mgnify:CR=1 FL=1
MNTKKYSSKHLSTTQRIYIEKGLADGKSFAAIARQIEKHPSTVAKEVKKRRYFPERKSSEKLIACARKKACQIRFLCEKKDCYKLCKACYSLSCNRDCRTICPEYRPVICSRIIKAPYVCNGCTKFRRCVLQHALYSASDADASYHNLLVSSREGINQSPADIAMLDILISPLLKKGQSMAHIYAHHGHEIPCSRRTLYNYIDKGVFSARNIDLRRRVRYKSKVRKTGTRISLLSKEFRIGRMYDDFQKLLKDTPDINVVEMDTVEGGKGNSKKVLLTMFFRNCSLMLIFLLEEKTQEQVVEVFDALSDKLGVDLFKELFPIILTDNGIEFQFPNRLECDKNGEIRTKIFYCNPNSSWQKGMIEKNHSYIRYVVPKGHSLDCLTHEDVTLLTNHINSEARDSLNGCSPYKLSKLLLNNRLHKHLKLKEIHPDQVCLKQSLLRK